MFGDSVYTFSDELQYRDVPFAERGGERPACLICRYDHAAGDEATRVPNGYCAVGKERRGPATTRHPEEVSIGKTVFQPNIQHRAPKASFG